MWRSRPASRAVRASSARVRVVRVPSRALQRIDVECPAPDSILRPVPGSDDLNSEQRAAAEFGDGPLLVVAGAGTGKTRTLSTSVDPTTDRILREEAEEHFGGNVSKLVSKLVATIALEAWRKAAIARIAEWSGYSGLSEREREQIEADIQKELAPQKPKRRRRVAPPWLRSGRADPRSLT